MADQTACFDKDQLLVRHNLVDGLLIESCENHCANSRKFEICPARALATVAFFGGFFQMGVLKLPRAESTSSSLVGITRKCEHGTRGAESSASPGRWLLWFFAGPSTIPS